MAVIELRTVVVRRRFVPSDERPIYPDPPAIPPARPTMRDTYARNPVAHGRWTIMPDVIGYRERAKRRYDTVTFKLYVQITAGFLSTAMGTHVTVGQTPT